MGLILDTNFIVSAEREARRGITDLADRFFLNWPDETFCITFTVAGELGCGHSASPKKTGNAFAAPTPSCRGRPMSPGSMAKSTAPLPPRDN